MRRVYLNIAAFGVLATALILWSAVDFLHLDAIERPYVVTAEFSESPGLRSGYEVTYLGHAVGRIRSVDLVPGMSEVQLSIDRDVELPADVVAAARRRSAIGEPYVDLAPAPGSDADGGPRLVDGDTISIEDTSSPLQYGDLFRSLDTLVDTIDPSSLGIVLTELAAAVDGRGDDIRRIVQSSSTLAESLSENGDEIEKLIDGVADITDVLATHRDALGSGLDSLASLTETLEASRPSIETLLDEAPSTLLLLNTIIDASDAAIICTIDGTAVLEAVLDDEVLGSLTSLLERSAAFTDVIGLLQDPRDGIFRLYVSPSGGEPPTVEFAEPLPYPDVPALGTCPGHSFVTSETAVADEASAGAGGDRPAPDGASPTSDRPDDARAALAAGESDAEADQSFVSKVLSSLWPWAPLAALAGAAAWFVLAAVRRRGEQP